MNDLEYREENGILIFNPKEYVELDFKKQAESLVKEQLANGQKKFLFNLAGVKLINSHGASAFLAIYKEISEKKGILAICCITELLVKETFQDTGILWLCKDHVYESEAQAIAALGSLKAGRN